MCPAVSARTHGIKLGDLGALARTHGLEAHASHHALTQHAHRHPLIVRVDLGHTAVDESEG